MGAAELQPWSGTAVLSSHPGWTQAGGKGMLQRQQELGIKPGGPREERDWLAEGEDGEGRGSPMG